MRTFPYTLRRAYILSRHETAIRTAERRPSNVHRSPSRDTHEHMTPIRRVRWGAIRAAIHWSWAPPHPVAQDETAGQSHGAYRTGGSSDEAAVRSRARSLSAAMSTGQAVAALESSAGGLRGNQLPEYLLSLGLSLQTERRSRRAPFAAFKRGVHLSQD